MSDYFAEKARQVEPAMLVAFGIRISSRYGKTNELIEMLSFCKLVALANIAHFVKEVFYDSQACICSFTLFDSVVSGNPIAFQLHTAAKQTIRQFELFGYVDHGAGLAEDEDGSHFHREERGAKKPRLSSHARHWKVRRA